MKIVFSLLLFCITLLNAYSQSNVITIDDKEFILTQAGFYNYSSYEGNEIIIFFTTENFNINHPVRQQGNEDYSLIWFVFPRERLETIEFDSLTEGSFFHSDTGRGSDLRARQFAIHYDGERISLTLGYNLYNGIRRRTEIEELVFTGTIRNVDIYNIYGIHVWNR